jgi:3-phytase
VWPMSRFRHSGVCIFVAILAILVSIAAKSAKPKAPAVAKPLTVPQIFKTQDWPAANVDSVALWRDKNGGALLFVTAKEGEAVYVCDGLTGAAISSIGKKGAGLGQLVRPNGVAVIDDYLFVTERDNHRIQVFAIPSGKSLLTFGGKALVFPYGLTIFRSGDAYELYVTDDYQVGNLGARVKHFRITKSDGALSAQLIRSFGELRGPGALQKVESILADPTRDRLFICDEAAREVKIYSLAGQFTGQTLGKGIIKDDPEGLALFEDASTPSGGWLIVTDQGLKQTVLRVFTRDGNQYVGAVTGDPVLANTDGITLSPGDLGPFKRGALYCVHNDLRVQAYSWGDIEKALNLRAEKR